MDVVNGDYRSWFMTLVAGKPFSQETLLSLESQLTQHHIRIGFPNVLGERTKLQLPDGTWVRVGFGEGHWVWIVQPLDGGGNGGVPFELEPGPFVLMALDGLRPFPPRPLFETLVADRLGPLAGADAALASSALLVTESPPDDLDGFFAQTIGAAAFDAANEYAATDNSPAMQFVDQGDRADMIRQGNLQYLPTPDTAITVPFLNPPALPGGYIARGGWEGSVTVPPGGGVPDTETSVRASIRYLYQTLLGHPPSQEREDAYTRWVLVDGHTIAEVEADLKTSEEYKQRQRG